MAPAEPPLAAGTVIAIDGPAASGKGTLARRLAAHFGFAQLDSGLLYRAVGLRLLRAGLDPADEGAAARAAGGITAADLEDRELRDESVGNAAGIVAANPRVRDALVAFQRAFARRPPGGEPGAVLDGRDIGTVICPAAPYKIFIEASLEERAARRLKELQESGVESIHARVLRDMEERDARDRGRVVAPLMPAEDAFVLDTTALDADRVFNLAVAFIASPNKPDKT